MDKHAPLTTTASTFEQENNQLLLNAIKCKFAAQTASEAASFSPPKFTIPTLKTFEVGGNAKVTTTVTSTATNKQQDIGGNQLNQFLIKQLQETQSCKEITESNGFFVPQLQFGNKKGNTSHFEIPLLKSSPYPQTNTSGISSLTTAIKQLKVQENEKPYTSITANNPVPSPPPAIDLTSALACKSLALQGSASTRDFKAKLKQQSSATDFDIPFIDCDRLDNASSRKKNLISENEYCLTDISLMTFKPLFKRPPSPVGQILSLVQKRKSSIPQKRRLTTANQYKLKVKHNVEPFLFDTKSPDDKVLESLSKYGRR